MSCARTWTHSGTEYRATVTYTEDDVPFDPTTVACKVMDPEGRVRTYTYGTDTDLGKISTGVYYIDITPNMGGRWHFRFYATGTNTSSQQEGDFIVKASPFVDGWGSGDYS